MTRQAGLRALLLALLLPAALLVACASEQERLDRHLAEAEKYAEAGQTREALIELRSALKLRPQSAQVNERIADVLRQRGRYEEAVFFYREAQRLDPQRIEPLLAEIPLIAGVDGARAVELVEQALERAPGDPRVHRRHSELALLQRDTEQALAAALTALELDPEDVESSLNLAVVQRARVREHRLRDEEPPEELFRSALEALERADREPGSVPARLERARILASWEGHREEAAAAYRSAVELAARQERLGLEYAAAEEARSWARGTNQPKLLRWALERLFAIDPEALAEAAVVTENADFSPQLRQAWLELVQLEQQEKQAGEAVLERLLERRPEDAELHVLHARFLAAQGRLDDALARLDQGAARGVDPPQLLDEAVRLALLAGKVPEAGAYLERTRKDHAGDPRTLMAEARLALQAARLAEAAELLRRVNDVRESAESHRLLAMAELRGRNLAAATKEIDRAVQLAPADAETLRLKAYIHHQAQDWSAVIATMRALRRAGATLTPRDRLLLVRPLYALDQAPAGRALLEELLAQGNASVEVAVAYALNEGPSDPARAAEVVDQALGRRPGELRLILAATSLDLRRDRLDRALARLDGALQANPTNARLLLLRAQTLARAERFEQAERDARAAFEQDPDVPGALPLLLSLYRAQDKLDEAVRQLEETEQAGLLTTRNRALLGQLHLALGDLDRARVLYEAVLREDPGLAVAKNDLAYLLARQGDDLDRALRLAQEAQEELGLNPNVVDTLGFVFLRKGLAGPAVEQLRYAVSLAEESGQEAPALLRYHLGLALRALGREAEAAQEFEKALAVDPNFPDAEAARRELEAARAAEKPPAS